MLKIVPDTLEICAGQYGAAFKIENTGDIPLHIRSCICASAPPSLLELDGVPVSFTIPPHSSQQIDLRKVGQQKATGTVIVTAATGETRILGVIAEEGSGLVAARSACFAGDTHVFLADGTTRAITALAVGDMLTTISERDHLSARPTPSLAKIEAVLRHDVVSPMVNLGGIVVTPTHRWATRDSREPRFTATQDLDFTKLQLLTAGRGVAMWEYVPDLVPAPRLATVWNLTTSARTFCVAAKPSGPFFVVHNAQRPGDDGAMSC